MPTNIKKWEYLHILYSIIETLGVESSPERVYSILLNSLKKYFDCATLSLRMYDHEMKGLKTLAIEGLDQEYLELRGIIPLPGKEYDLSAKAFMTGEPVYHHDLRTLPFPDEIKKKVIERYKLVSYLTIPIKLGNTSVGTLSLMNDKVRIYSEEEVEFLKIAGIIGGLITINSIRLEETLKAKKRLDDLISFSRYLSAYQTLDLVIETAAQKIRELFELQGITIAIFEKGVETRSTTNIRKDYEERLKILMEQAMKRVIAERERFTKVFHLSGFDSLTDDDGEPFTLFTDFFELEDSISVVISMIKVGDDSFSHDDILFVETLMSELRVHFEKALAHKMTFELAIRDPLTGLYSRKYFIFSATLEIQRAERTALPLSLLVLDIDDFKDFNDRFGHPAGDRFLKWIAKVMRAHLRSTDIPCRLGGEEFAIILPNANTIQAEKIAERLRAAVFMSEASLRESYDYTPTISIGITTYPDDGKDLEEITAKADKHLYIAKMEGKNRWFSGRSPI